MEDYIDRKYTPTPEDLVAEYYVEPKGISLERAAQLEAKPLRGRRIFRLKRKLGALLQQTVAAPGPVGCEEIVRHPPKGRVLIGTVVVQLRQLQQAVHHGHELRAIERFRRVGVRHGQAPR